MFLVFWVKPCQFQHQVKRESGEPLFVHMSVGKYSSGFKTHLFLGLGGNCLLVNTNLRLIHKEFAPPCFLVPSAPVTSQSSQSQSSSSSSSSSSRSPSHQSPSSRLITHKYCYMMLHVTYQCYPYRYHRHSLPNQPTAAL